VRIPPGEIKYRRKIGTQNGKPVYGIGTVGGLHVVAAASPGGGDLSILGVGSHPLLASTLALRHDGVVLDELSKADVSCFGTLLEEYAEVTALLRKHQGLE
jgi:hypothetical protein